MTSGLETSEVIFKRKDTGEVNKKGKYKQEKKKASYNKQKEASDKANKHTNNQYSPEIYNVFHSALGPGGACTGYVKCNTRLNNTNMKQQTKLMNRNAHKCVCIALCTAKKQSC